MTFPFHGKQKTTLVRGSLQIWSLALAIRVYHIECRNYATVEKMLKKIKLHRRALYFIQHVQNPEIGVLTYGLIYGTINS
jgi:hypothetical protein